MATQPLPPIPNQPVNNSHEWREWFFNLWQSLGGTQGQIYYVDLNFTGSNITSIQNRAHNDLQGLQGGNVGGTEYYHLSASQYNSLTTPNYGAFQDSTTQSAASTTTAYPITFNTTDFSSNVTMVSSSRITFVNAGLYNIQFSLQLSNLANSTEDVDVWFRLNGTNVAKSNSIFGLDPRKNVSDPYHVIAAINFFIQVAANDYVELMWRASNTAVTIKAQGAQTSPTRPATPSAILTVNQIA